MLDKESSILDLKRVAEISFWEEKNYDWQLIELNVRINCDGKSIRFKERLAQRDLCRNPAAYMQHAALLVLKVCKRFNWLYYEEIFSNLFPNEKFDDHHKISACKSCQYFFGKNNIHCAIHPFGPKDDGCEDWAC